MRTASENSGVSELTATGLLRMRDQAPAPKTSLLQTDGAEQAPWRVTQGRGWTRHHQTRPQKRKPNDEPRTAGTTRSKPSSTVAWQNSGSDSHCQEAVQPTPSIMPATQQQHEKYISQPENSTQGTTAERAKSRPSSAPSVQEDDRVKSGEEVYRSVPSAVPSKKRSTQDGTCPSESGFQNRAVPSKKRTHSRCSLERFTRGAHSRGSFERLTREAHSRGPLERPTREAHSRG